MVVPGRTCTNLSVLDSSSASCSNLNVLLSLNLCIFWISYVISLLVHASNLCLTRCYDQFLVFWFNFISVRRFKERWFGRILMQQSVFQKDIKYSRLPVQRNKNLILAFVITTLKVNWRNTLSSPTAIGSLAKKIHISLRKIRKIQQIKFSFRRYHLL